MPNPHAHIRATSKLLELHHRGISLMSKADYDAAHSSLPEEYRPPYAFTPAPAPPPPEAPQPMQE